MYPVKQSTALTVPFFAHDANGDGVTGLTDGSFTKRISKNGGAFAAMTVTISEMENGWYSFPLSTSHSDTNGILSISFSNASAKRVNLQFRVGTNLLDDVATNVSGIKTKTDFLPSATAGAAGGVFIAGTNAATTITSAAGNALTLSSTGSNGVGLAASGNGTGAGIRATGGATGHGFRGVGGATSGVGIRGEGTAGNSIGIQGAGQGSAAGINGTGGATGHGIRGVGGATSGVGIRGEGTAGNSIGIQGTGQGSASGINGTGGATGHGIRGVGGATSGHGISGEGGTLGHGMRLLGVGASQHGLLATSGSSGTADGISAVVGGGSGVPIRGNITGNLSGSVGSVTGAVGSVTAAVTLPTIPANWITAAGINAAALNGKGDWNIGKTGYSISGTITTLDGLNNLSAAAVNAEVDTALADIHLDHLLAVDYDPAAKPGVATALLNEVIENDGAGVSRFTAGSLAQAPDTDHVGTGTGLTAIPWNANWDVEVESEVTDALTAYSAVATTDLPANFSGLIITAGIVSADVKKINAVTVLGAGTSGNLWRA